MRNRQTAAILALILGIFGVHRFYLGQTFLGIVYCFFFWTGFPALLGVIDAVLLAVMDQQLFDAKYNREFLGNKQGSWKQRDRDYTELKRQREGKKNYEIPVPKNQPYRMENPAKQSGIVKYKDYDFKGAIEDFKKALLVDANDTAIHFNIACAYSITEQPQEAFYHLSKAVEYGFADFDKIGTHDALAYTRIQPEWDSFVENGYKIMVESQETPAIEASTKSPDLLEQLHRLGELKERGLLDQFEFEAQKKKILG